MTERAHDRRSLGDLSHDQARALSLYLRLHIKTLRRHDHETVTPPGRRSGESQLRPVFRVDLHLPAELHHEHPHSLADTELDLF